VTRRQGLLLGYVGGNSDNVSNGNVGPSYLNANNSLSNSNSNNGARLAFVPQALVSLSNHFLPDPVMTSALAGTEQRSKSGLVPKGKGRKEHEGANMTKRLGNIWDKLVSYDNIKEAYQNARKGKTYRPDVRKVDAEPEKYILEVQCLLKTGEYHTSEYRMFEIHEKGKTREVADLPFFPDRIIHWAVMQVIHEMIMRNLIAQSYAALPGRGAHQGLTKLKTYLKDPRARFYLKLDIRKFFPSIRKDVMMQKLEKRIKDVRFLDLCRRIVYEYPHEGLPIGNYTSQYFANFYLSDLDHYLKEVYHVKWLLHYMDDYIILGWSKAWLHRALKRIQEVIALWGLTIKRNWCIRPVEDGIDWVGYKTFPDYCLLRKRTKMRLKRACRRIVREWGEGREPDEHDRGTVASYFGCLKWCDGHLLGKQTVYPLAERLEICRS